MRESYRRGFGESNQLASEPPATLVVFPGALGDIVCLLPALCALRSKSPRLHVWCKGDLVELVAASGLASASPIESREVAWLFSASPPADADRLFGRWAAIECFTGAADRTVARNLRRFVGERGRLHPFRPEEPLHLARHFLRSIGAPCRELPSARLPIPLELRARMKQQLAGDSPLLVIAPGSGARAKRWSRAGFAEIARRWQRRGGRAAVLLGPAESGEERFWTDARLRLLGGLRVIEAAALLARADAYLGNDSGVSHLAAAAGARGIALFGPTDPALWRPLSPAIGALRPEPWCDVDDDPPPASIDEIARALTRVARGALP